MMNEGAREDWEVQIDTWRVYERLMKRKVGIRKNKEAMQKGIVRSKEKTY